MITKYWQRGTKQKVITVLLAVVLLVVLFILRDDYQPAVLFIRKYIFLIALSLLILVFSLRVFRKTANTGRRVGILVGLVFYFGLIYVVGWHFKMYDYMKTYNVYQNLNKIEIVELPLTQNERIQPLRNIFSMANESVGETKDVSLPHLVRVDGINKWTMAIQPTEKYIWQRISDNTEEVFSVSSTTPFPSFSSENRILRL